MRLILLYYIMFALCVLTRCSFSKIDNKNELLSYVNDTENGLNHSRIIGETSLKVTYYPYKLLFFDELKKKNQIHTVAGNGYCYFILDYSLNGKDITATGFSSLQEFSERLQTLAFSMSNYVYILTDNNDTIRPSDSIFPRTYGLGSSTNILLAFDEKQVEKANNIIFNIEDIGLKTGRIRFVFMKKDIEKTNKIL